MPTSKSTKEKIARGVTETIDKRNRVRTPPKLAALARLPGDNKSLKDLMQYARKARDHLQRMAAKSEKVYAQIVKDKEKEFQHWGMTPGDKEGIWTDELGPDRRIVARNKAIDAAKKAHAKTTEEPRENIIKALRAVAQDLRRAEPLFHSQVAMLLRQTMADGKRAQYAQVLQGAGVVAVENAVLDCINGTGNRPLGAAIITIIENSKELQKLVRYSREEIADALVSDDYWAARESIGLLGWFIEQAEVAVLELEGKGISTDRKMRAGLLKSELEATLGKSFNDDGDEVDSAGELVDPAAKPKSDADPNADLDRMSAEEHAKAAERAVKKRTQDAVDLYTKQHRRIKDGEKDVDDILAKWAAEDKDAA